MLRLLIVDDEHIELEAIQFLLTKHRPDIYSVETARNGLEAYQKMCSFLPQIILMDIRMPHWDGIKSAIEIRKKFPDVQLIFITAFDEFNYAQQAVRLGASEYLLKPVRPSDLLQILDKIAQKLTVQALDCLPLREVMPSAPSHYQDDLIQKACYFIESNFNQKLSLTEVAETLHLSTPYFSKLFKRKTGLNFVNYLLKIRMDKACELLQTTYTPIQTIAKEVGYSDVSHFTRLFHKETGHTPKQYRTLKHQIV